MGREGPAILHKSRKKSRKRVNFTAPDMKDLVVVEAHLRDLLRNAPIKLSNDERRRFNGLRKWLNTQSCYLKELGINAIELQPIQQFDSRSLKNITGGTCRLIFSHLPPTMQVHHRKCSRIQCIDRCFPPCGNFRHNRCGV